MKAAIYTRVSTDMQAEVEFNSCEAQELKIRSFIKSQDNIEVYKVYSDQGYTGANIDRPALQEMLQDLKENKINMVISYKIDRLTRSPKDFYQLIEVFEAHNASFLSVTERFDTSTPSGRLLRNIMLTFGQFERELTSERTRDKLLERAKKGFCNGGNGPFGYKRENKRLVIVSEEANIVRKMFNLYLKSASLFEVYKEFKKNRIFNRNGQPFGKTVIGYILRNILYTGKVKHNNNLYDGLHEAIISEKLFNEVQDLHKERPKESFSFNYSLLSGLVRCKECGSIMSSAFTNKIRNNRRRRYFYYRCTKIDKLDRSFCSIKQVSADRLDSLIIEYINNLLKDKQYFDSFIFRLNHDNPEAGVGLQLRAPYFEYKPEILLKVLQNIVDAADLKGKIGKRIIVKRHIEKVIYSKETIEVKILYSESAVAASGLLRKPPADNDNSQSLDKDKAAFRHFAPSSRLSTNDDKSPGGPGFEPGYTASETVVLPLDDPPTKENRNTIEMQ